MTRRANGGTDEGVTNAVRAQFNKRLKETLRARVSSVIF